MCPLKSRAFSTKKPFKSRARPLCVSRQKPASCSPESPRSFAANRCHPDSRLNCAPLTLQVANCCAGPLPVIWTRSTCVSPVGDANDEPFSGQATPPSSHTSLPQSEASQAQPRRLSVPASLSVPYRQSLAFFGGFWPSWHYSPSVPSSHELPKLLALNALLFLFMFRRLTLAATMRLMTWFPTS